MSKDSNENLLISYFTLRKAIGYVGIGLPFILIIGGALLKVKGENC